MAGRRRQVGRSKPSSIERETGSPASRSGTSAIYAAIAKKAREKKEKEAKAKAAKDKAAKELKQKNAQAAEDKRLKLAAQKEANELARAEAEVNSRKQREDASRRMIQMAEASAKKAKDKKAKEAADKRIAEAKAKAEELAAKRAEAEKRRADKAAAAAKAAKEREAKAAADKEALAAANKAAEEKAAKQAARLEQIRMLEEREQFRRGEQLQIRQQEAKRIREAKAAADAKAAVDAKKAADAKAAEDKRIADAKAAAEAARAAQDRKAAAQAAKELREANEAKAAAEAKRVADANREVKTVDFTADQLVDKYNNSPGAQDFKLTSSYDPKTNTFIEDVSAFGFEGDAATNTYTPEEFIAKLGYKGDDYNTFSFVQPQQLQEAPPLQEAPTGSMERTRVVDPVGSVGNSDRERKGNEDPSLQNTVAPMWAAQPPEFKFTAEPVPRINPAWNGLEEWKAQQQDPEPTPPDTPGSFVFTTPQYDPDPKLNALYNSLSYTIQMGAGIRALTQEEAAQQSKEIKDLEQQIIAAGGQPYKYFTNLPFGSFRGEGPDPTLGEYDPMTGRYTDEDDQPAPVPSPGPAPTPPDMPPGYPFEEGPRDGPKTGPAPPGFTHSGGPSTMAMVPFYNPTTGEEWTASSGGWSPAPGWVQGSKPADWKPPTSADPAPTLPDMPVQPAPDPLPESPAPKPPTFIDMDPLKGMRDQFVPRNILGQSYDPQVREDFVKKMQSGANITSTPSYQMPTSPIPQTQFGGYGQPMPMSPLAPYAGLGAAPLRPTDYDEPYDEDALPGGPSGPRDGGGVT